MANVNQLEIQNETYDIEAKDYSATGGIASALQDLREQIAGKVNARSITGNRTEITSATFSYYSIFKLDGTQFASYSDFIAYGTKGGYTPVFANNTFLSNNATISLNDVGPGSGQDYILLNLNTAIARVQLIMVTYDDIVANKLPVGFNIYVVETNYPDRWVDGLNFRAMESSKTGVTDVQNASGTSLVSNNVATIPTASASQLGLCKPDGTTITADADGTLHSQGGGGTQKYLHRVVINGYKTSGDARRYCVSVDFISTESASFTSVSALARHLYNTFGAGKWIPASGGFATSSDTSCKSVAYIACIYLTDLTVIGFNNYGAGGYGTSQIGIYSNDSTVGINDLVIAL